MRVALKIKTCIIFLAWLTIFVHSVIPHNHAEELCLSCNGLIHTSSASIENNDSSLLPDHDDDGEKLCHLSSFLFNNFNPEGFFLFSSKEIRFTPLCATRGIYVDPDQPFISLHSFSVASFRAPPAA